MNTDIQNVRAVGDDFVGQALICKIIGVSKPRIF